MTKQEMRDALERIAALAEELPSGIDYTADPGDTSPGDMTAHIGGLIWQECDKALRASDEGK